MSCARNSSCYNFARGNYYFFCSNYFLRLTQVLEDELHLTACEVPVIDPIARSEQRGQEAVGHKLSTNFREFIFPLCAEHPKVSLPLPL